MLPAEKETYDHLLKDLPDDVEQLESALDLLKHLVQTLMHKQEIFFKPDLSANLKCADKNTKCLATSTVLLIESVERLLSARLLFLTGHQSRCLSCVRDAYECLLWSDICFSNENEANKWIDGKMVKRHKSHQPPAQLSSDVANRIQHVLSTWGTHPYILSCLTSVYSTVTPKNTDEDQSGAYEFLERRSLIATLHVAGTAAEYVLIVDPSLESDVENTREIISQIKKRIDHNIALISE